MDSIGKHIKELREQKGITQQQGADCLGITQSNYGRKEKNDRRISVVDLIKISELLETTPADILNRPEQKRSVSYREYIKNPELYPNHILTT